MECLPWGTVIDVSSAVDPAALFTEHDQCIDDILLVLIHDLITS